jgi:hypothetical protein
MIVILGYDGLEHEKVLEYQLDGLMLRSFGKTDISMFSDARTMVIWSSFLASENLEKEILSSQNMWSFKLPLERTFFSRFEKYLALDVPGFSQDVEFHKREREMLAKTIEDLSLVREYDAMVLKHHNEIKEKLFSALDEDYELIMAYFDTADMIGHVSFGINAKMRIIYKELESIARDVAKRADHLLILSDHGMKAVGRFGDHSSYGYWATNLDVDWKQPKITELAQLFLKEIKNQS